MNKYTITIVNNTTITNNEQLVFDSDQKSIDGKIINSYNENGFICQVKNNKQYLVFVPLTGYNVDDITVSVKQRLVNDKQRYRQWLITVDGKHKRFGTVINELNFDIPQTTKYDIVDFLDHIRDDSRGNNICTISINDYLFTLTRRSFNVEFKHGLLFVHIVDRITDFNSELVIDDSKTKSSKVVIDPALREEVQQGIDSLLNKYKTKYNDDSDEIDQIVAQYNSNGYTRYKPCLNTEDNNVDNQDDNQNKTALSNIVSDIAKIGKDVQTIIPKTLTIDDLLK